VKPVPTPTRSPIQYLLPSLIGRLRYPWVFVILAVLFVVDLLVPDPIPFVDELMLALLTFLVGSWRGRKGASPEAVDVTPSSSGDKRIPPETRG
jgi:hypothetical protein